MPLLIDRLCEEFGYRPEEAWHRWWTLPAGFLERVLEARAYRRTKAAYESAPDAAHQPTGPLANLVRAIEFDLVSAAIKTDHV